MFVDLGNLFERPPDVGHAESIRLELASQRTDARALLWPLRRRHHRQDRNPRQHHYLPDDGHILFVQPTVLSGHGAGALTAICLASALGTLLMAGWRTTRSLSRRRWATTSFAFTVVVARGTPWQTARSHRRHDFHSHGRYRPARARVHAVESAQARHRRGINLLIAHRTRGRHWRRVARHVRRARSLITAGRPRWDVAVMAVLMARGVKARCSRHGARHYRRAAAGLVVRGRGGHAAVARTHAVKRCAGAVSTGPGRPDHRLLLALFDLIVA